MTREQRLARTALLMSPAQMERLAHAHVMLLGLGGVGGHAAEALARGGVGRMTIVDHDTVSPLQPQPPARGAGKHHRPAQDAGDVPPPQGLRPRTWT